MIVDAQELLQARLEALEDLLTEAMGEELFAEVQAEILSGVTGVADAYHRWEVAQQTFQPPPKGSLN